MPTNRYSLGAMILHWAIAIAVIVNWQLAGAAEHVPPSQHLTLMGLHMATGMLILLLTLVRLIWRWTHKHPPLGSHLARWEVILARTVHYIFYTLLVGLPLLAWVGVSMQRHAVDFYGLFNFPILPTPDAPHQGHFLTDIHGTLANIMLWLVVLHVLGALKHQFWDKDGDLYRMLPFGTPRSGGTR